MKDKIIVLDFGSQYAHLIAKRFRLLGYYSEIMLPSAPISAFEGAKGIVLSGGPSSIYAKDAPEYNAEIFALPIPILGLCYGHYVVSQFYGGTAARAQTGEFGFASLRKTSGKESPLFSGIEFPSQVWMSHQDEISVCAPGFEAAAYTENCRYAAVQNLEKKRFGLQFHAEVKDTLCGNRIFENFAGICGMEKNWSQDQVLEHILHSITTAATDKKVLLFLSGGVDSTVAFALLNKALGQERVLGLHIDNGFMRKNESRLIAETYQKAGFHNFITEDASESFLAAVHGLTDPQKKRMAVGENFITVRNTVTARMHLDENEWLLAQGTLYPDIIESGGTKNSKTIKTHHNRVDGIQKLIEQGLIIEPLKDLYKDEVRLLGTKIGLPENLVMRHPFPGPGLSINVLCSSGALLDSEQAELESAQRQLAVQKISVYAGSEPKKLFALPVKSVGVQGDFRTYRFPAALDFSSCSSDTSKAGNTAPEDSGTSKENAANTIFSLPSWDALEKTSSFLTNSVSEINRTVVVLYRENGCTLQEGYCDKLRLDQTREADAIVLDELHAGGWYRKIFQHLTINLPYAAKKDHCSIVLRPVVSEDVMTARFAHLDRELLLRIVNRIAELGFVDALFYDITNKPPATFGWE
ncbi:MAG: glutamine-hydrolyzing GMP synthase [Bacteroides sp.]|nr:glutamine-hydrolyzing GMP synthase [Prevotella sp.]MCM1408045.1 glutamine-hydrolyzing GMP synthase [Treponema brennaborense]MCM1469021.1 glutamine-hydrolyzing GMP synthase [Bacteroides sp.]